MPKLPRVSGATVVRSLERLGFVKVRQSGILRQADVSPDEFLTAI